MHAIYHANFFLLSIYSCQRAHLKPINHQLGVLEKVFFPAIGFLFYSEYSSVGFNGLAYLNQAQKTVLQLLDLLKIEIIKMRLWALQMKELLRSLERILLEGRH